MRMRMCAAGSADQLGQCLCAWLAQCIFVALVRPLLLTPHILYSHTLSCPQVRGQVVYFGPQGLPALEFAAAEWGPAAAGSASELLALHRAASAAAPLAIEAAASATDQSTVKAAATSSVAALAFNDAEVLVEAVTEADHRGEAAGLAAAYAKSRLAQVGMACGNERGGCAKGVWVMWAMEDKHSSRP